MCPHGEHVVLLTRYAFCNLHGKRVVVGARVITKVAKILWMVTYDEKKSTAKWLIRRQSLCGCYRFREAHQVMRQRPDPMIGGLVYETLSLVCAEFQIANVGGSSHQSL